MEAEGRGQPAALLDQPKLTAGSWVSNGGAVLERTLAEALGVRITLNGRPYAVAGIAVTAAEPPYPNLCYIEGGGCAFDLQGSLLLNPGLAWVTEPDARALASAGAPLSYFLNLRLRDPATATAFARAHNNASSVAGHRSRGRGNEPDVQEPGACDLDTLDGRVAGQLLGDRLRHDPRRQARFPGHPEREIRGVVTVPGIPRPLDPGHRRQHGPVQVPVGQHGHGRGHDHVGQLGGSHTGMLKLRARATQPVNDPAEPFVLGVAGR